MMLNIFGRRDDRTYRMGGGAVKTFLLVGIGLFSLSASHRNGGAILVTAAAANANDDRQECGNFFNYEVERRIQDQLVNFLAPPQEINAFFSELRSKKGFPSGTLGPSDRDLYFKLILSFPSNLIYFALEDGHDMGYDNGFHFAYYREPGNSGYRVDDPAFEKHLKSCVEASSGEPVDCLLEPGRTYIKFFECESDDIDCDLYERCPDVDTQALDCETKEGLEAVGGITKEECIQQIKWCRKYTIETVQPLSENETTTGLGYIPESYFCYNEMGEVTQTPGDALSNDGSGQPGHTCVYEDGKTVVQRNLSGDYAYCGANNGTVCNGTFTGAFYSPEYDGRYRPWYINAKERQQPHWSDPYLYETGYIGISNVHPIYTQTERGQIFYGVLAVDYKLEDFATFLLDNYQNTSTVVAIYEDADPHYLVGMSTGTQASAQYLASDPTQLCPTTVQYDSKDCVSERRRILNVGGSRQDEAVKQAYLEQEAAGYPQELLFVKLSDDVGADSFVCQATLFEPNEGRANLKWRIITVSPASESSDDTILRGDTFFGVVILIGLIGVGACTFFWWYLYSKREVRAVAFADWRFTCVFVAGCGLLNTGTFTLLGENTATTCLLRVWFFHLFFVVALAPLFIKVWRMYKLTKATFRRTTITNTQAALYTLPFIATQVTILLVFTFVDPPKPTEVIESDGGFTRSIVCQAETNTLFIIQIVFEAGLVLVGCALAFLQRNMDEKFGESKQMLVAMYNIALVGIILLIVINVADMDGSGKKILQAIGVLWGSVLSAASFVVPRMIQINQGQGLRGSRSIICLSGAFSGPFSSELRDSNPPNKSLQFRPSNVLSSLAAISESADDTEVPHESEPCSETEVPAQPAAL